MDSRSFTGDDDRDLACDPFQGDCRDCGARWDEDCAPDCGCKYCTDRRARQAAKRYVLEEARYADPEARELWRVKGMLD